jgi:hypothetical protein
MRIPAIRTVLPAFVALLAALPAAAQESSSTRLTPYVGLAAGAHDPPGELQGCGQTRLRWVGEARAGVALGRFALEARGSTLNTFSDLTCAYPDNAAPPLPGVYRDRLYTFGENGPEASADLRLRYGGRDGLPVVASLGGGRLFGPGLDYLLAGVGLRAGGARRLALDFERHWYRGTFDEVEIEVREGQPIRELSREPGSEWWSGLDVRVGFEIDLD